MQHTRWPRTRHNSIRENIKWETYLRGWTRLIVAADSFRTVSFCEGVGGADGDVILRLRNNFGNRRSLVARAFPFKRTSRCSSAGAYLNELN